MSGGRPRRCMECKHCVLLGMPAKRGFLVLNAYCTKHRRRTSALSPACKDFEARRGG